MSEGDGEEMRGMYVLSMGSSRSSFETGFKLRPDEMMSEVHERCFVRAP